MRKNIDQIRTELPENSSKENIEALLDPFRKE